MARGYRVLLVVTLAPIVAGVVVALWPLHANGVSGTAVTPHYRHPFYVGVTSYQPLPARVTVADLHRLGVRLPGDAVEERRRIAAVLVAAGAIAATAVTARGLRRA